MIRQANKYDKTEWIETIKQFGKECPIPFYNDLQDEHLGKLFDLLIVGRGVILIEQGKGLIAGILQPTVWNPDVYMLHELAWYVKPEFRNGYTGYRLLKAYIEHGKKLKEDGTIKMFIIGKFESSPNVKYGKFGFTKLEESWTQ